MVLSSDWQLGKITPSYSSEVCERRVERFCQKTSRIVEIQRRDHPVKKLALLFLGDMIEGELIFPGQAHEIDSSLYDQLTINGPRIMAAMVKWASDNFEQVDIYAVPGNHGQLGGRQRKDMHPRSNADRMLYQFTSQLTANLENVTWNIADDWWLIADLGEGCRFFLLHGGPASMRWPA